MTARLMMSILVRLVTGHPKEGFETCARKLCALIEGADAEVYVSNQVIGEAYVVLQHHYGVSKSEATRAALVSVLRSGLVAPLNGAGAFVAPWNRHRLWPARPTHCR